MTSKKCTKCGELKPFSEFHKENNAKDGQAWNCKFCRKLATAIRLHSKHGLILRIYNRQISSSKQRGHAAPNYTKDELAEWFEKQSNFDMLYLNWINSGYDKNKTPSIDRINDYLPYTFNNIILTTWQKNRERYYIDKITGVNNKDNKPVIQMSKAGVVIAQYHSINHAGRVLRTGRTNIGACCARKRQTSVGFKWEFAPFRG